MRIYQSASLVDLSDKLDPVPAALATTRGMLLVGLGRNESLGFTPQSFRHSVWMIVDATYYSGHLSNKIGRGGVVITINNEAVKFLSRSFSALTCHSSFWRKEKFSKELKLWLLLPAAAAAAAKF